MPTAMRTGRTPPAKVVVPTSRSRPCRRSPRARRSRRSRSRAPASSCIHSGRRGAQQPHGRRQWRCGNRCPAAGGVHAVRPNLPGRSTRATCSAAVSTLSSRVPWGKPPADGRPNSPGVRQLLAYAQQLISENFPKPAAIEPRQPPPPRLYQGVPVATGIGGQSSAPVGTPSARVNPGGTRMSPATRSWTDARPRPINAESMPPRKTSSTFSTPA